jgi:hypothetical protein
MRIYFIVIPIKICIKVQEVSRHSCKKRHHKEDYVSQGFGSRATCISILNAFYITVLILLISYKLV